MIVKNLASILIINFNNAAYLDRAIRSCLNQTYKNIEILIFDDKSSDGSQFILEKYKKNNKIRYFLNKSKKMKIPAFDARNAYNYLIGKCRGEILFMLDSDDFFLKDKVLKIFKKFNTNRKINFIQDLPLLLLKNNKIIYKKNSNNIFSYWPYLSPMSCISFRKNFILKYNKSNISILNKFPYVWLDFRTAVFSYYVDKSFYSLNDNLTGYMPHGESKKYKTFGISWFIRRKNSFDYFNYITKKKS